jgi:hypothetical protein
VGKLIRQVSVSEEAPNRQVSFSEAPEAANRQVSFSEAPEAANRNVSFSEAPEAANRNVSFSEAPKAADAPEEACSVDPKKRCTWWLFLGKMMVSPAFPRKNDGFAGFFLNDGFAGFS